MSEITNIPYRDAWKQYYELGWVPLPLPPNSKFPPPDRWTGGNKEFSGETPSKKQCVAWAVHGHGVHKAGNIALRLPKNVVGIDVDMYDGKAGRETLAEAEAKWGPLPPTYTSGSRADGSGIRLYRVPKGLAWASRVGGDNSGIEIVRWDHRYAVVAPSIHPDTGLPYLWLGPDWQKIEAFTPALDELADMPEAWINGLTNDRQEWVARPEAQLTRAEVTAWLATRPAADGDLCSEMEATVRRGEAEIEANGAAGLHDAALRVVWGVLRDAAHGHTGIRAALARLRGAFFDAAKARDTNKKRSAVLRTSGADGEWFRAVSDGVLKVAAEIIPEETDACAAFEDTDSSWEWRAERAQSEERAIISLPEQMLDCTDKGNAERLQHLYGRDVHWLVSEDLWLVWNGDRWRRDYDGQVERWAMKLPSAIEREAGKFDGDDAYLPRFKALKGLAHATGARAKRSSALADFKSISGISVRGQDIDKEAAYLQCGGSLVELRTTGAVARRAAREDLQTLSTATGYDAAARHDEWETFIKRSIPDEDLRRWVQKAVGYSLLGANPERKIFFVKGKTSTGKSVFAEAIRAALGEYAGAFSMTLFRAQKEAGPNVQLVRLLDKRMAFSSETSAEQYLHADQLKQITGGDVMSARLNRSNDMIERVPAFTAWIMTNHAPTIRGADAALGRRLLCIPFDESIPEDEVDPFLGYRLRTAPEAHTAVLAWAVRGWDMYAREGLDDIPAAVSLATMEMKSELSTIDQWIDEECVQSSEASAVTDDLFKAYRIWCEDAGVKDVEDRSIFGKRMVGKGFKKKRFRVGQDRQWGFSGIGLCST